MPQKNESEIEQDFLSEQQRLRDEVQRLRDEQQRLRDEQQKIRDQPPPSQNGKPAGDEGDKSKGNEPKGEGSKPGEQKSDEKKPEDQKKPEKKKRMSPVTWVILGVVLVALAIGGYFLWGYLSSYESTDDAQVDGHINSVSSRISGTVTNVYVDNNQMVKAGEVLVDLDPRDYQVALEQAQAQLSSARAQVTAQNPNVPITNTTQETTISTANLDIASAEATLAAAEQDYLSTLADIRQAQATHNNDEAEVARYKVLVDKDEVSREQYDAKVTAAKASLATVEAAQAKADSSRKQIDVAKAQIAQAQARARQAQENAPRQVAIQRSTLLTRQADLQRYQAQVDQALLNLQYCKVAAPANGIVGKKSVEAGTRVSPGQELMAVVPVDDIWVTANFKETQLRNMKPGQRVTIKADAFKQDYEGYLESMPGASGAKFSLLPPENATGNYVKVVQRLPVRIRLKNGQNDDHRLRPGMSVEPKVWLH